MFNDFCESESINIIYSADMPKGYETAFGSFDILNNTLFVNESLLAKYDIEETIFHLYHELRHAVQYHYPERFSKEIQESLSYVILNNGEAYKLNHSEWLRCYLDKKEVSFDDLYKSLPYEIDANNYAYARTVNLYPEAMEKLSERFKTFKTDKPVSFVILQEVFKELDKKRCRIAYHNLFYYEY